MYIASQRSCEAMFEISKRVVFRELNSASCMSAFFQSAEKLSLSMSLAFQLTFQQLRAASDPAPPPSRHPAPPSPSTPPAPPPTDHRRRI